jgi:hypothetical protein
LFVFDECGGTRVTHVFAHIQSADFLSSTTANSRRQPKSGEKHLTFHEQSPFEIETFCMHFRIPVLTDLRATSRVGVFAGKKRAD